MQNFSTAENVYNSFSHTYIHLYFKQSPALPTTTPGGANLNDLRNYVALVNLGRTKKGAYMLQAKFYIQQLTNRIRAVN